MKILFLINSLGSGGSEYSLGEMLPVLTANGVEVSVACLHRRENGVQQEVEQQGIELQFLSGSNFLSRIQEFRKLLRSKSPDLLHTTLFEADQIGRIASIGSKVPVLSSLVNVSYAPIRLQEDPNLSPVKWRSVKLVDSITSRYLTTHFHAVTETVKTVNAADLRIPLERVTVIERGRNTKRLGKPSKERRQRTRQLLGIDESAPVLINVGRQEYQKGQRYLLEAVALLRSDYPNLVLLIAGESGRATKDLTAQHQQLQLGDHVRFLGFRKDISDLLAAADIFVFPSLFEGVAGAVIEAMALDLPIVVSDLPTLYDVVEPNHNALMVPLRNAEQLAIAIRSLLIDQELRQQFGKRSGEIFHSRFSLEKSVVQMIALYKKLVQLPT